MLVRIDVNTPARLLHCDDPSYNDIAGVGSVVTPQRFNENDTILNVDHTCNRSINLLGVFLNEGAMTCDIALAQEVTRHYNSLLH